MSDTETKPTHTPGPWRLSKHRRFDVYADTAEGGLRFVGTTYGNGDMPPHIAKEDEANAKLIAAAPALLASLKAMVRYFDTFYDRLTPHDVAVKVAADTAIAKAEGRAA
jgi:hypothetical protein